MEVEVKMNSEVYNDLMQKAVDLAIERTANIIDEKVKRFKFYNSNEVMQILGYSNKKSLKKRLKDSHIPYRILGRQLYVSVEDLNTLIETSGKIYGK